MAVLFARFKVADMDAFKSVHCKTRSAHAKYNITETVWHDIDDPRSITIAIRGSKDDIDTWRNSDERSALAKKLKTVGDSESWLAQELFAEGNYEGGA